MAAFLAALLPALVGAAGQAGVSAIGAANAGADRAKQTALLKQILAEYGDIDVPVLEQIVAETLGPSAMEGVQGQLDPRLRTEQLSTLETLGDFAQDGDTATSRAAMHRILSDVARQEGAGRNAILNNMRARGLSGSGAELAMQLDNQQDSADRAHTAGLDQAAQAQRRMMEAVVQKGSLAGQIRGQDYGEATDLARARDAISRYNTDARTRAGYHNNALPERQFDMNLRKTGAKANAAAGVASNYGQSADRSSAQGAGIGQAITEGANAIGGHFQGQRDQEAADKRRGEDRAFLERIYGGGKSEDESIPYYLRRP